MTMSYLNILIVEDEAMARRSLANALTGLYPEVKIAGETGSVTETLEWLRNPDNRADIIFMDVELSDGNCFEIFRQSDVTAQVIMTTAYDSYAVKAFEVESIDYLLKPISTADLRRAVEDAWEESHREKTGQKTGGRTAKDGADASRRDFS